MLRDETEFIAHADIHGVEVPSTKDQQSADRLVTFSHADQIYRHRSATYHYLHRQFPNPCRFHHCGKAGFHSIHIPKSYLVTQRRGYVPASPSPPPPHTPTPT